ncbi:MAG: retroviral-like aspartic protease family protein [Dehalococcoidia bacterium]
MIRGYFTRGVISRPFVTARLQFPNLDQRDFSVEFLIDTGADRTTLSPVDARRIGLDVTPLPQGLPSTGVGGRASTGNIDSVLTLDSFSASLTLTIIETPLPIPSLLGRDILSRFALFLDERAPQVLLLDEAEVASLNLPG